MRGKERLEGPQGPHILTVVTSTDLSIEETRNGEAFLPIDASLAAPDEDDFHILKRRHDQVQAEETLEERRRKLDEVAAEADEKATGSGNSKIQRAPLRKPKVVNF